MSLVTYSNPHTYPFGDDKCREERVAHGRQGRVERHTCAASYTSLTTVHSSDADTAALRNLLVVVVVINQETSDLEEGDRELNTDSNEPNTQVEILDVHVGREVDRGRCDGACQGSSREHRHHGPAHQDRDGEGSRRHSHLVGRFGRAGLAGRSGE